MMGTGKTAVGRALASRSGVRFVDLDQAIEERAGGPIASIFAGRGEAAFRSLERELLLAELADPLPRVVALGGGALLDRATRLAVLEAGHLFALEATVPELLRRLA